ncbi:Mycothiol maleylpyruvate isomerase N-terminal domain-containing protein [Amycolatopsis arida]|uniref:Mycothiol maleylpyruvate isomerase N-terminal domain-containing protein n=1 Tax=Amycolatopsis arida TaxID=587909 RepID=A0A1I5P915_9PSEU|nr:maleylpyruvate isomerase N-terminal domain-containing protein [Amycolatopsis arida]TDX98405.1 mycothiol maleylpyruvate isomerase-like protein [Amycolatopsis arida]SFP30463.1 Mycothiol maleylpyruvate isomerase N-terminal domain-containing protein [Amycolatopsis arida]
MAGARDDFLAAARSAAGLLREPAVAVAWREPSALPGFGVAGLAGHLAYQVLTVASALADPVPEEPTLSLLEHYDRAKWVDADLDDEVNVRIRQGGEHVAAPGAAALADRVDATVSELTDALATAPERPVRIPLWGPWSLMLEDLLVTRLMELAVHSDDLAVSVGVTTPELPPGAVETVVDLLSRLAVRRHGPTAVLRALSRAERAPSTIAAF